MDHISESKLVYGKEPIYFAFVLLFSILTYVFFIFSIIGIVVIGFILLLSMLLHGLALGGIRRNGVKLSEEQFPELYSQAVKVATDMGLPKVPQLYVVESEGMLNAFATRFFKSDIVVLYSGIFDLIEKEGEKEVLFVLAHEFAHLKRKHILMSMFILPAMWIPFLGNAYLRACEYTCDRYAAHYIQSPVASRNALTMLAIGRELYTKVNQDVYMKQIQSETGFFVWLNEKLSTHPHLPKRIYEISRFYQPEETDLIKEPKRNVWIGLCLSVLVVSILGIGMFYGISALQKMDIFSGISDDELETTPLMDAALNNDVDEINALLQDGSDINEVDMENSTALHWAINFGNYDAANALLTAGANPNTLDIYEMTPLMSSIYTEDIELVKLLLKFGADSSFEDAEGLTAYDYAVENEELEMAALLKEK